MIWPFSALMRTRTGSFSVAAGITVAKPLSLTSAVTLLPVSFLTISYSLIALLNPGIACPSTISLAFALVASSTLLPITVSSVKPTPEVFAFFFIRIRIAGVSTLSKRKTFSELALRV